MSSVISRQMDDYQTLALAFQDVFGVVITEDQRLGILARLNRVMQAFELDHAVELAEKMRRNIHRLNTEILRAISEEDPKWFKHPGISRLLREYLLAHLPEEAVIWVVGCGEGSVAYSHAIDMAEAARDKGLACKPAIIATDVSPQRLEVARRGCYRAADLQGVADEVLTTWLSKREDLNEEFGDPRGDVWQIKPAIREMIEFRVCNLLEESLPGASIDAIICPDTLLYFANAQRGEILYRLARSLKPGGVMLAGEDQTIVSDAFERVHHPAGLFYRKKA